MSIPAEMHDPSLAAKPGEFYARYDALPTNWRDHNSYWYYGWAVTEKDLKRFHEVMNVQNYHGPYTGHVLYGWTARQLCVRSGYRHISFVFGEPDEDTKKKQYIIDDKPTVMALALSCTRSRRLFWERPSEKQMERLVNIIGEQPRWILDHFTKEEFSMDWIS
ncbi:hypothetical protein BDN72DRAFT_833571 [Pluteus cervinus]|uniref:Uncharacterized protein n=1 Tax=Pluteus cervinus TaxID=181527 RepID=A0ACD3B7Y0_9AGAR|nr:hypothetical protein BDN72DRAFT_833571 [Pluteus cervinus]